MQVKLSYCYENVCYCVKKKKVRIIIIIVIISFYLIASSNLASKVLE